MPYGFRGWRGMGRGFRGGMGFGFRGSSPPWPYIGLGRGGLPRCGYFLNRGVGAPPPWPYGQSPYSPYTDAPFSPDYGPYAPQMTGEQELDFLRNEAEAVAEELEQIETRIRELESEKQEKNV